MCELEFLKKKYKVTIFEIVPLRIGRMLIDLLNFLRGPSLSLVNFHWLAPLVVCTIAALQICQNRGRDTVKFEKCKNSKIYDLIKISIDLVKSIPLLIFLTKYDPRTTE